MLSKAVNFVKETLFPIFCVDCQKEGEWWCQNCLRKNIVSGVLRCPVCDEPSAHGRACSGCEKNSALSGVVSLFPYSEGEAIGKLIKQFKYNRAHDIQVLWEEIILKNFSALIKNSSEHFWKTIPTIIPVPLFVKRERERGFNQAELIGQSLSQATSWPLNVTDLKRLRATAQQAKLTRPQRQTNVAGAFAWQGMGLVSPPFQGGAAVAVGGGLPSPELVILVDDVYTTGATMQEAARVLKLAGSKEVWGFTLARD